MKRPPLARGGFGTDDDPVCLLDGRRIVDRWTGWEFVCPEGARWHKPKIEFTPPQALLYTFRDEEKNEFSLQIMPDLGPIPPGELATVLREHTRGMVAEMQRMAQRGGQADFEKVRVRVSEKAPTMHDRIGAEGIRTVVVFSGDMKEFPFLHIDTHTVSYSWLLHRDPQQTDVADSILFKFTLMQPSDPKPLRRMARTFTQVTPPPLLDGPDAPPHPLAEFAHRIAAGAEPHRELAPRTPGPGAGPQSPTRPGLGPGGRPPRARRRRRLR